jgi:hypothetical protein
MHMRLGSGHRDQRLAGQPSHQACSARKAGTRALASRLWLIDQPPYMLRWEFYDAPEIGSRVIASQEAISK